MNPSAVTKAGQRTQGVPAAREFLCAQAAGRTWYIDLAPVRGVQHTEHMQINPTIDGPLGWLLEDDTPVFSLAQIVGGVAPTLRSSPIVLLESSRRTWGIMVERLLPVQHVDPETVYPLPRLLQGRAARFCHGVVVDGETLHIYLSSELLDPENPAQSMADPIQEPVDLRSGTSEGAGRLLLFRSGRSPEFFGVSLSQVVQILSPTKIYDVPGLEPPYLGMLMWRSSPLPVLDVGTLFGLDPRRSEPHHPETSRFLVVRGRSPEHLMALVADHDVQLLKLPVAHQVSDALPPSRGELVLGSFELDQGHVWIPSVDGILGLAS